MRQNPFTNKKQLSLQILFKFDTTFECIMWTSNLTAFDDAAADHKIWRINESISHAFPAKEIFSWFNKKPLIHTNTKDQVSVRSHSIVVLSFFCCCAQEYICLTNRHLQKRINQYTQAWLTSSAILGHFVETCHSFNPRNTFKVIL